MSTVFIGGSRRVTRLPLDAKERINNVAKSGHNIVIGDANGADKATQRYLMEAGYDKVTVFCSGAQPRNNLGQWPIRNIAPPQSEKGFQYYAVKDRAMAREADFGLMIWDSESPGTVLNVLRLVRAGKIAVLFDVINKSVINFKRPAHWDDFIRKCSPEFLATLQERALPEEWLSPASEAQSNLFVPPDQTSSLAANPGPDSVDALVLAMNAAMAAGNPALAVNALGQWARAQGMTQIAKQSGLARESLYRSLGGAGNPEFATVLKVIKASGLRLEVCRQVGEVAR